MRWPWMTVRDHDAIMETMHEALAMARADASGERSRRRDVELRLMGVLDRIAAHAEAEANRKIAEAKTYTQPPFELPAVEPLSGSIIFAIEQRAMRGTPEWRILETEARRLQSQGTTTDEIRHRILEGEPVEW